MARSIPAARVAARTATGAGLEPERLLTVKQVAEQLEVCRAMVHRLCAEGRLPHARLTNSIRMRPSDLDAHCRDSSDFRCLTP
ncbi:MAG: helix-turn-helix domain-containing protein [Anaeromyxobacter sp.]|nr:helix-turn-helix domain-containing protein [Anaeromyxobacter sp.]MBL0276495.1 helix-turn-helix domain-containing protein [Anaeromyxobacter sp.]